MKTMVRVRFVMEKLHGKRRCIKFEMALPLPEKLAIRDPNTKVMKFFRKTFVVIDCEQEVKFWYECGETIYREVSIECFGLGTDTTLLIE